MARFSRKYVRRIKRRSRRRKSYRSKGRAKGIRKIVKKVIDQQTEDKYVRSNAFSTIAAGNNMQIYSQLIFTAVGQGTGIGQRIGLKINVKYVRGRIKLIFNQALYSIARVFIAKPKLMGDVDVMDAVIADLFPDNNLAFNMGRMLEPNPHFRVLFDTGMITAGGPAVSDIHKTYNYRLPRQMIQYSADGGTQPLGRYPKLYVVYFNPNNPLYWYLNDIMVFEDA